MACAQHCRARHPVADIVNGVVALGRVDEHRTNAIGEHDVGEIVEMRDERARIA